MSTYREMIYMAMDLVKLIGDDSTLTEEHAAFLIDKYRSALLLKRYMAKGGSVAEADMQTICMRLVPVSRPSKSPLGRCLVRGGGSYALRTASAVPVWLSSTTPSLTLAARPQAYVVRLTEDVVEDVIAKVNAKLGGKYIVDGKKGEAVYSSSCADDAAAIAMVMTRNGAPAEYVLEGADCGETWETVTAAGPNVSLVSIGRLGYVPVDGIYRSMVYSARGVDGKMYVKGADVPSEDGLTLVVRGVFDSPREAARASECKPEGCVAGADGNGCDYMDMTFPMEDSMTADVLSYAVRDILGATYRPKDPVNNASDDLSSVQAFIRQNMKDKYLRGVEGTEDA